MTIEDKEILELASKYLEKGEHTDDDFCAPDWFCETEQLLKIALVMYNKGICEGAYQQSKRYMGKVFGDPQ